MKYCILFKNRFPFLQIKRIQELLRGMGDTGPTATREGHLGEQSGYPGEEIGH